MKKYLWIPLLVILIDQATKLRVSSTMNLHDSIEVWGNFFRITFVANTGAAFSLSLGSAEFNRIFFIVSTLIAVVVLFYLLKKAETKLSSVAYSLIIGGAVGNLIDRIAYGSVIDFFDFDFFDFIIHRWPVFNIADSVIVVSMFLLIIDIVLTGVTKKDAPAENTSIINS